MLKYSLKPLSFSTKFLDFWLSHLHSCTGTF